MAFRKRRDALRAILTGSSCIRPGSVYDAISIRIAEDLGFELGMFGGSVASLAVLGDPDITLITLTEIAEQMRRMSRASTLPVLVDADHGYGNALNVRRTVQELEAAGAAGLTIEDTLLPQAYGAAEPQLISLEEGVGKMKAALDARSDPALVIMGRTGTRGGGPSATEFRRLRRAREGVRGHRRRCAVLHRLENAPGAGDDRGCDHTADRARQPPGRAGRSGIPGQPAGADRVAGSRAVRRRHAGRLRNLEGVARRGGAEGPEGPAVGAIDRPRHARRRREAAAAEFLGLKR